MKQLGEGGFRVFITFVLSTYQYIYIIYFPITAVFSTGLRTENLTIGSRGLVEGISLTPVGVVEAEGTACAKPLGCERAWHIGAVRRAGWLGQRGKAGGGGRR